MKGYKAFDKDLKCRDFQYEIGKEYEITGKLEMCGNGFHFCETLKDCYRYYPTNYETRICEIEALGEIIKGDNKCCTSKIRIIRELTAEEHNYANVGIYNIGCSNKGHRNKGDFNEGDFNEGDSNNGYCNKGQHNEGNNNYGYDNSGDNNNGYFNIGDFNEGRLNKGDYNKGYCNKGEKNIGIVNIGIQNIGDHNEGCLNIGIRNKGDYQVGICNTKAPLVIFNRVSKMTLEDLIFSGAYQDIIDGNLTHKVREIDTFDENVWEQIFGTKEPGKEPVILNYGIWYPIEEYYKRKDTLDWALVLFKEKDSGNMKLPHVAKLVGDRWYLRLDDRRDYARYINEDYKAVAFMLWKPYVEVK